MSDWSAVCDAILGDLSLHVPALSGAPQHRYAPWNPEALAASTGELHVAVWPLAEAEVAQPLAMGGSGGTDLLNQAFTVLIWQGAMDEAGRQVFDEDMAKAFLDLHNAVRARFFQMTNLTLAGSFQVRYSGGEFDSGTGGVRWMRLSLIVQRVQSWTP